MELRPGGYGPNKEFILCRIDIRNNVIQQHFDGGVVGMFSGGVASVRLQIRSLMDGCIYEFEFPDRQLAEEWLDNADKVGVSRAGLTFCASFTQTRGSDIITTNMNPDYDRDGPGIAFGKEPIDHWPSPPQPEEPRVQPISDGPIRVRRIAPEV